ncbi:MAG: hypothetical protein KGI29_08880 [Pseudomonadota bacterium]|nr:hypothetical protein [Pseudomonadota bacterium]MDE3037849.1 hypothetical protein [Pseudomonadota bacterium]
MPSWKHTKRMAAAMGVALLVSGCRPFWLWTVDPSGPPEYKLGWEDGCDSGLSAEGSWDYKLMYGFKKRTEMSASDQYKQGWNEGFTYCRYSLASSKGSVDMNNLGWGE